MHPKPPAAPAVMASTPWESDLTRRLGQEFGAQIQEFSTYLGQNFLVVQANAIVSILDHLRCREGFDYLVDITAVDWPNRSERFDLVYILYSFASNERIRLKSRIHDGEKPQSATSIYPTANWLEREIFDLFGIGFAGHPDLRRILLPDDWRGHPLRKDYGILQMDNVWVKENLGIESGQ